MKTVVMSVMMLLSMGKVRAEVIKDLYAGIDKVKLESSFGYSNSLYGSESLVEKYYLTNKSKICLSEIEARMKIILKNKLADDSCHRYDYELTNLYHQFSTDYHEDSDGTYSTSYGQKSFAIYYNLDLKCARRAAQETILIKQNRECERLLDNYDVGSNAIHFEDKNCLQILNDYEQAAIVIPRIETKGIEAACKQL
jgi:hypothetical protein